MKLQGPRNSQSQIERNMPFEKRAWPRKLCGFYARINQRVPRTLTWKDQGATCSVPNWVSIIHVHCAVVMIADNDDDYTWSRKLTEDSLERKRITEYYSCIIRSSWVHHPYFPNISMCAVAVITMIAIEIWVSFSLHVFFIPSNLHLDKSQQIRLSIAIASVRFLYEHLVHYLILYNLTGDLSSVSRGLTPVTVWKLRPPQNTSNYKVRYRSSGI